MQKLCVLLIGLLFLHIVGCTGPKDKQYFMTNPETLKKFLLKCQKKPQSGGDSALCQTASEAYNDLALLITRSEQQSLEFGQEIIGLQVSMAALKAEITQLTLNTSLSPAAKTARMDTLQTKLTMLQQKYAVYMAVIRIQGV